MYAELKFVMPQQCEVCLEHMKHSIILDVSASTYPLVSF